LVAIHAVKNLGRKIMNRNRSRLAEMKQMQEERSDSKLYIQMLERYCAQLEREIEDIDLKRKIHFVDAERNRLHLQAANRRYEKLQHANKIQKAFINSVRSTEIVPVNGSCSHPRIPQTFSEAEDMSMIGVRRRD